jgi:hypothetical protein
LSFYFLPKTGPAKWSCIKEQSVVLDPKRRKPLGPPLLAIILSTKNAFKLSGFRLGQVPYA